MSDKVIENIIEKYFEDNSSAFVQHHLESYNDFFNGGINRIFKQKNPIRIRRSQDESAKETSADTDFNLKCDLWLGGKNGDKLHFGKPTIHDEERSHYMYPNEARLRNMTYAVTIHYDVEVEYFIKGEGETHGESPTSTTIIEKVFLGRFPIMLMSDLCLLNGFAPLMRFEMGECKNDRGGYFIIDGKEKCIVSQEKFADNTLYVRDKVNDIYSHSAEIRSVSEDPSKPVRTLQVRVVSPNEKYKNNQIVVNVPNVRKPLPLFILMRALGVESDKEIIDVCLLDVVKYSEFVDLFIPSIHDTGHIFNQEMALAYIASLTKGKTIAHALEILSDYFLPHIGVMNLRDKAYFLGHMVKELLKVFTNEAPTTDRDSFRFKRVELPGSLIYDLFNEYFTLQQRDIFKKIDAKYHYNQGNYKDENFAMLVTPDNYRDFFSDRIVESGFKRAFKGNWGAAEHTKRLGVIQDLNRLTYNSAISHLRKINLDLDASAKVVAPRLLHSSQWGIIDPLDTPDGGNVGLHKHMSIAAYITSGCSATHIINWMSSNKVIDMKLLNQLTPSEIGSKTKVFVNGRWIGVVGEPVKTIKHLKQHRRSALIPLHTSISWKVAENLIDIYTDSGRLSRPIFYMENGQASYVREGVIDRLKDNKFTWKQLTGGFAEKKRERKDDSECLTVGAMYNASSIDELRATQSVIEYLDTSEAETSLISMRQDTMSEKPYTHLEIHPALILGVMGNQVVFPENNPLSRDLFACGQMRQAVSLYHSNFQTRIDKMGVVLNNGQVPLVKSRFLKKINNEEHPYGENVIVAIMCYTGYNVEDSILFNEGSVKRGLFRTTYYNSYEDREDSSKVGESQVDSKFANVEQENVDYLKTGFDYGELDDNGLIRENTQVNDKTVLIGKIVTNLATPDSSVDDSVSPKKGQMGFVDKAFITEGEEGFRIAKIRVRDERVPSIGDKFCSRCGQKGTVGLIIPEASMPFTDDGIRPDIIINPHAIPSRMTIGQLVETLMGKACSVLGGFGDCTAFTNKGPKHEFYGSILTDAGFHSSGCQMMYNGETGMPIEANIYIGPTYYMRLKHMVKDKINYRARGPRTALTRQTVQGRANDGGLRIGEMERDGIIAHGATKFLQESMLVRGDDFLMAVCNQTGMLAIYNESHNLFLSPFADGPLRYSGTFEEGMNIENVSRFGRSFSIVRVPYAFKLMMQELQTMNVQMRVITETNVDQLASMAFSNNIVKLLGKDATPESVANASKTKLREASSTITEPMSPTSEAIFDKSEQQLQTDSMSSVTNLTSKQIGAEQNDPMTLGWELIDDVDGETNKWSSLIMQQDEKGYDIPSDFWDNDANEGLNPQEPPNGWKQEEAVYADGTPIPKSMITQLLKKNKVSGNWAAAIAYARETGPKPTSTTPLYNPPTTSSVQYNPETPPYNPNATPVSPAYSSAYAPAMPSTTPPSLPPTPPTPPNLTSLSITKQDDQEANKNEDKNAEAENAEAENAETKDSTNEDTLILKKIEDVEKANTSLLTTIEQDTDDTENEGESSEKKNVKLN